MVMFAFRNHTFVVRHFTAHIEYHITTNHIIHVNTYTMSYSRCLSRRVSSNPISSIGVVLEVIIWIYFHEVPILKHLKDFFPDCTRVILCQLTCLCKGLWRRAFFCTNRCWSECHNWWKLGNVNGRSSLICIITEWWYWWSWATVAITNVPQGVMPIRASITKTGGLSMHGKLLLLLVPWGHSYLQLYYSGWWNWWPWATVIMYIESQ